MVLSDEERDRFAAYLESTATDNEGLARLMDLVSSAPTAEIAKKYRTEALACRVVAQMLRSCHTETLK